MAKMRSNSVLLGILLENNKKIIAGLCLLAMHLLQDKTINAYEYHKLREYIKSHRPDNRRVREGQAYYWLPGAKKPRISWLKQQIEEQQLIGK